MRTRTIVRLVVLLILATGGSVVQGQTREYQVKTLKQYWLDQNNRPWSDLSCQMAVRIDPQHASNLGTEEISNEAQPPIKYEVGKWRLFGLKRDARGTYADVEYLVYKDSPDPITYQIELQRNGRSITFAFGSSRIDVSNDTVPPKAINLVESNKISLKDWLFIVGVMLTGLILVYVLIFRWLFNGLLFKRRWAVPGAEHFTWSMSLLVMLALAVALTLFYLGPRLETWIIIAVMGAFWLLHGVVWLVSGKEA